MFGRRLRFGVIGDHVQVNMRPTGVDRSPSNRTFWYVVEKQRVTVAYFLHTIRPIYYDSCFPAIMWVGKL